MVVRTQTRDPASTVTWQWMVGSTSIESGLIGVGGGEVTLDVPIGETTLNISVRAPQSNVGHYRIDVVRFPKFPCDEEGILDAIAFGGGPHFFACNGPTTVVTQAEIVIDNDVILDGEGNLTLEAPPRYWNSDLDYFLSHQISL